MSYIGARNLWKQPKRIGDMVYQPGEVIPAEVIGEEEAKIRDDFIPEYSQPEPVKKALEAPKRELAAEVPAEEAKTGRSKRRTG